MDKNYVRRRVLGFVPAMVAVAITNDVSWAEDENEQCRGFDHPCEGNQECCDGLTCVEGGGQGNAARCVECADSDDCAEGSSCVEGRCVVDPECSTDEDCPEGEVCVEGICLPEPECKEDADCPEGQICDAGICITPTPPADCTTDKDCGEGHICLNGQCVSVTPPTAQCKAGLTNEQCCIRIIKKVCRRKQSSNHAKRNCKKRGIKRCRSRF